MPFNPCEGVSEECPQLARNALIAGGLVPVALPKLLNGCPVLHPKVPVIAPKPPPNGVLGGVDLAGDLGERLRASIQGVDECGLLAHFRLSNSRLNEVLHELAAAGTVRLTTSRSGTVALAAA